MKSIIVRACVPALSLACVLVWLVPATRTAWMHVGLFLLWGLTGLLYARRHGLFTKTIPQIYEGYRHRVVPAFGRDAVALFFAAVTDVVWRVLW